MSKRAFLLPALLLTTSTLLVAQQSAPQFRAGAEAVLVDLRVVDANGSFVRGLTRDDFQVFEDGEPQTISTLEMVDLPIVRSASLTAGARIEPDVSTNDITTEGRVYVLVLDDMDGPFGDARASKEFVAPVRTFIEQHLADGDLAALITTSGRKDVAVPFTDSRERLLEVLDRFALGYGPRSSSWLGSPERSTLRPGWIRSENPQASLRANTTRGRIDPLDVPFLRSGPRSTMLSVGAVARWLEGISNRRKAIVLFQGGDVLRSIVTGECGLSLRGNDARWGEEREDTRTVIEAAGRGNVSVFALAPVLNAGLVRSRFPASWDIDWVFRSAPSPTLDRGRPDPSLCQQGVGAIARDTGGFVSMTSPESFERVVLENSSYYMLGYSPADKTQDERFRQIDVRVTRPDLHVTARSGYVNKPNALVRGRTPSDMLPGLVEVLQSPLPVPNLPLAVSTPVFRGRDSQATVNVVVEAGAQDLFFDADGEPNSEKLLLEFVAADVDGKVKAANSGWLTMEAPVPANLALIREHGARFVHQFTLKPGRYHVRVAAYGRDNDRGGSAHREIVVPDFSKSPLTMSDLAIASSSSEQPFTSGVEDYWWRTLGAMPTAQRVFTSGETLTMYAELYDNTRAAGQAINVTIIVRASDGDAVFTQEGTTPNGTSRVRTHPLMVAVPMKDLEPGAYVLEVSARGRTPSETAARQIPFTVESN